MEDTMRKKRIFSSVIVIIFLVQLIGSPQVGLGAASFKEELPTLGEAEPFSVLASQSIASIGVSKVTGGLGISPGTEDQKKGEWIVEGESYFGPSSLAEQGLKSAKAYADYLKTLECSTIPSLETVQELTVLNPGVYCYEESLTIDTDILLDSQGDPEAKFVFKVPKNLEIGQGVSIASPELKTSESVYWLVDGDVLLEDESELTGTLIAEGSITAGKRVSVTGRLITLEGGISVDEISVTTVIGALPPEPTEIPTVEPTQVPTELPTPEPTAEPTQVPTEVPTELPTLEPTLEPTEVPTVEPTQVPTELPTPEPTAEPTQVPTEVPTELPTLEPTLEPTEVPTELPTPTPTPDLKLAKVITPTSGNLVPDHYMVVLKADFSAKQIEQEIESAIKAKGGSIIYFYEYKVNGYLAKLPPEALTFVRADPLVDYLEVLALQEGQTLDTEVVSPYFAIKHITLADGTRISEAIINGPPTPPQGLSPTQQISGEATLLGTITSFPSYSWVFGCSAVSGSMIAAYYDRNGYSNIYAGPTNGGLMPITDTSWPEWYDGYEWYPNNPLIASHNGVDGRSSKGSIDDYWIKYLSNLPDPYITGGWTQHTWGTAVGDYMKTSQSYYGNVDGSTSFYYWSNGTKRQCNESPEADGMRGLKQFFEARGYTVSTCYTQLTDNDVSGGFTLANFKAEIDAGHPVLIHVQGHTMVGFGYSGSTIYIRDTWDSNPSNVYSMTWGGSYQGMELWGAGVLHLASISPIPSQVNPIGTITDVTPTYTWTVVNGATQYMYQVVQGSTVIYTKTVSSSVCNESTCSSTPSTQLGGGDYSWRVKAYVGAWKNYSAWKAFKVKTIPTIVAPVGVTPATSPSYKWSAIQSASQYNFQVLKGSTLMYSLTIGKSYCDSNICTYNTSRLLSDGVYTWRVRSYIGGVWRKFSPWTNFTVKAQPGLVAPVGTITDTTPTYTWKIVPDASKYAYQLVKNGSQVYYKEVSTAGCGSTTCSSTPSTVLGYGTYTWRARAYVGTAWRTYSAAKTFTIKAPVGFSSQFNGSMKYWSRKAGGTWQVSSSYMYTNGMGDSFSSVYRNTAQYENFDYSARVKRIGGSDYWEYPAQYLAIRMGTGVTEDINQWYPGYVFGYAETGRYSIWERNSDGTVTSIQPWTYSSAIRVYDWNVLRVVANGSNFRFYINGSLVYTFSDSSRAKGYVGFEMYKIYGYTTQFQVDWATLSIVNPATLTEVISPEQEALNQAALLNSTPSSIEGDYLDIK